MTSTGKVPRFVEAQPVQIEKPRLMGLVVVKPAAPNGSRTCPADTTLPAVSPLFRIGAAKELPVELSRTYDAKAFLTR